MHVRFMRFIYFTDNLTSNDLNAIHSWAMDLYGLNFKTRLNPIPGWEWIKTSNNLGDYKIIGIKLPSEQDEVLFKLKFPIRTHGAFTTIEVVDYGR